MSHPRTRRLEVVESALRERGFELTETDAGLVARSGTLEVLEHSVPLSVTYPERGEPLLVVSQVANAAQAGHVPLLIVDQWTREAVRSVLADPFALAGRESGGRRFYSIPDRILLTDDTFACTRSTDQLQWQEAPVVGETDTDVTATEGTDSPQLLLQAGDRIAAVLESVDALRCPGPAPEAFATRYERVDDRFQVYEGDEVVGSYADVRAMRTDGYAPTPLPLVPEHHVRSNARLARGVVLAAVEGDTTSFEPPC